MKTVIAVRHSKSDWESADKLDDFERPLNARGRRDALTVALRFFSIFGKPNLLVSSSALRAVFTARIFSQALGMDMNKLVVTNALYEASDTDIHRIVTSMSNDVDSIMLFGHNPGISGLVMRLANPPDPIQLPTTGLVVMRFANCGVWTEVADKSGVIENILIPKES